MITINVWPNPRVGATVTLAGGGVITSAGAAVLYTDEIAKLLFKAILLGTDPTGLNPNPSPLPAIASGGGTSVASASALAAYANLSDGNTITQLGYATAGDGGQGEWRRDASDTTTVVDGGTVIACLPTGRLKRIYDPNVVHADWFDPTSGLSVQKAINKLTSYPTSSAGDKPGTCVLGPNTYANTTTPVVVGSVSIVGQGPALTALKSTGGNANLHALSSIFQPSTLDANGVGAITIGQKTFPFTQTTGFVVGDLVFCLMGSDPHDVNEPGGYWFDNVASISAGVSITLKNGAPEGYPNPNLGAVIWGGKSHIYKCAQYCDGVDLRDLTLDSTLNAGDQALGNYWYTRNYTMRNVMVKATQGGFAVAGCTNFTADRIHFQNSAAYLTYPLVSGRLFSLNGCRNSRITNVFATNVEKTAFFFEAQNRGCLLENIELHSTSAGALQGDPFFFVVGGSKGIVAKNVRIQSTVARQFSVVDADSEFRTEDLTVDGLSCAYLDLTNHSGQLSLNGTVYGPRKTWTKNFPVAAATIIGQNDFLGLPKGAYAVVRAKMNDITGVNSIFLLTVNGGSPGLSLGAAYGSVGTLVTVPCGAGTLEGLYADDNKKFSVVMSGVAPVNSYFTLEIEYFPASGDVAVSDWNTDLVNGPWSATAAPTIGTWARGNEVHNSLPAVGQPKSWKCTIAGTPGTWVSTGNL